jgi:glycosyltransferase 2 family protein
LPFVWRFGDSTVALGLSVIAIAGVSGALIFGLAVPQLAKAPFWSRLPEQARIFATGLGWAFTSREALTRLTPLSLVIHGLSVASIYCAGRAAGVEDGWALALAAGPVMVLAQSLPISVGGWGVREMAAVLLAQGAGVDTASVVVLSLIFGLCGLAVALPGAIAWLSLRN